MQEHRTDQRVAHPDGGAVIRHGSPRLDRVRGRFRDRPSGRKHHTAETATRRESGLLAGRRVLYPPQATPPLLPDGIGLTELPLPVSSATRELARNGVTGN